MANEMLKPERLWGGEVGADWETGGTKLSATLFANRLTNAIANVTLAPNLNQRQNLDAIDSKGVEVAVEQRIGPAMLRATYAYTDAEVDASGGARSEEHTSELQSLMRISYAVFCLKKKKKNKT